ncbi:hypothetical protein IW261DRAFT_1422801 [Armillaria novae-zelandiae]|uniref:PH domain-containing protein n=1 Tax=Armillaria novae-zelandiae TaxID=153914 RepID=A0AA39P0E2_9AGAR|nr:hypothetical protein IW261DRAFT_1422801 [Armillaria novae-zelandiae]
MNMEVQYSSLALFYGHRSSLKTDGSPGNRGPGFCTHHTDSAPQTGTNATVVYRELCTVRCGAHAEDGQHVLGGPYVEVKRVKGQPQHRRRPPAADATQRQARTPQLPLLPLAAVQLLLWRPLPLAHGHARTPSERIRICHHLPPRPRALLLWLRRIVRPLVERPPCPIVQVPLVGKWNPAETTAIVDPAKRAEAAGAGEAGAARQAEIQRMKEESPSLGAARRMPRSAREREKRFEEHRRPEQWRTEQARIKDDELRREEADRNKTGKLDLLATSADTAQANKRKLVYLGGAGSSRWRPGSSATINDLVWRRRFYKFIGDTMFFYRSPKDMNPVIDPIQLHGKLNGQRNGATATKNSRLDPTLLPSNSRTIADKLLGVLHYTAGL